MSRDLFGTDGIRGIAGEFPLDDNGAKKIGRAVGTLLASEGQQIVVGQDPRQSSEPLVKAICEGLGEAGAVAVRCGVIPTPGLSYITRNRPEIQAGIMVTASHNSFEYNGVKVFNDRGEKLTSKQESSLNDLINNGCPTKPSRSAQENGGLLKIYEDFLVNSGISMAGLKIAIDTANGAASGLGGRVFNRLDAKINELFNQPNGTNINDGCGATNTKALAKTVVEEKLDFGIAVDGDADRVIMVDHLGREVKGDYLLYILAVTQNMKGVVATVMSNLGFARALKSHGIELIRTPVGDHNVIAALNSSGYRLGGEESGHIVLPAFHNTGDGLLAAVQVTKALLKSNKTLAQWCDEVDLVPQVLVNLPLKDKSEIENDKVKSLINKYRQMNGDDQLILIRPSGTEPLLRIMVQSANAKELADQISNDIEAVIK